LEKKVRTSGGGRQQRRKRDTWTEKKDGDGKGFDSRGVGRGDSFKKKDSVGDSAEDRKISAVVGPEDARGVGTKGRDGLVGFGGRKASTKKCLLAKKSKRFGGGEKGNERGWENGGPDYLRVV